MKRIIILLIAFCLNISSIFSQNNEVGKKYIYEFRDGTTIIGTFVNEENGNIYINDMKGEDVYIPKVMIGQIHGVTSNNIRDGEYWFPNLHDSRYFFSPSAFGLEQGEGYYSHSYWLLWQTQFGITDNLSIGGGTTPFGIPASFNAKYSYKISKSLNAAIGYFYVGNLFGAWDSDFDSFVNMPYTVVTKGSKENNFTLGMGYNLDPDVIGEERVVINFGGTFRTARRFSFVFEGWVFNPLDEDAFFLGGPGIRYFRKVNRVTAKNGAGGSTWDFQFLMNSDVGGIIPMFGASRKF